MKQHEAVILTLEKLGGVATLGQLYSEVFKVADCDWGTKTPLASVRRIVQKRPEIFKIKPGLYGLVAKRKELESQGLVAQTNSNQDSPEVQISDHTYYQALLLLLGKMKGFACWSPDQDKNKQFLGKPLGGLRTLQQMPAFSYGNFVQRSRTIDVIWFNERQMPSRFIEVEYKSDFQNSLLKFNDLQDFHAEMLIVSASNRRPEFDSKLQYTAFRDIRGRVKFVNSEWVVKDYEHSVEASEQTVAL